ncbi:MAG: hypothetical protein IIX96_00480, partial [Clostridia bacterium]|nr:hypothetical protein [Clostridia bacterium]
MKKSLLKHRSGPLFSAVTAVVIILLLVVNVLFAYLGQRKMIFADLTPEGLYTLTGAMKEECDFVDELDGDKTVNILFCTDPDYLIGSAVSRIPYFMSVALDNRYENISVDTVNVATNPTAVAAFKTTSLSEIEADDVIISYGDRYKIVSLGSFWRTNS